MTIRIATLFFVILATMAPAHAQESEPPKRVVIAASTVFDGRGKIIHNARVVIEGAKIVAIDQKSGPVDYDLRGLTVMPGWIDAHVHLSWTFGLDGKNAGAEAATPFAKLEVAKNALATLNAGFTTVQSVGSPIDVEFREAFARRRLPGPSVLTSAQPLIGQGPQN